MLKPKIITILGQTATGKSDFAVDVAKIVNGEIISADSRQVYKGMDLGTGKITKKEMRGIPHHLLDIVSPKNKTYSVNDYQIKSRKIITDILKRGKIPVICGGTGYYIDSIIKSMSFPNVPPNNKIRKGLENKSTEELFIILKKIDKVRSKNIDSKNKVRLIRAIEIAKVLGKVPSLKETDSDYEVIKIGLTFPKEELKERIHLRLISRIKKGMLLEMARLHKEGVSWKKMESFGLEYRYSAYYLQGKMNKDEMTEKLFSAIWHFAKKQDTWFKKDKEIVWINPKNKKELDQVKKQIMRFLK